MKTLFIIYDNDSSRNVLPLGSAYIAAHLVKNGIEANYFNQDVFHYTEKELYSYLCDNPYDIVGLGFTWGPYQINKVIKIAEVINSLKNRPKFVLGGHGPSPVPEYFLNLVNADAVVIGEGELTFHEYVKAIQEGKDLVNIEGLAYRDNNKRIVVNRRRPVISDLELMPWPYTDKLPMEHYINSKWPPFKASDRVMPMITSRGCDYSCNFCYRLEKGIRQRDFDDLFEEIKFYKKEYRITYIFFQDELLMSSKNRMIEFCERMLSENLDIRWRGNGRLNVAVPEVLKIMKKAGCDFINYGIESFDNESLRLMNKKQTEEQIVKGIENTRACGIKIGFNFIFGNLGDTKESIRKSLNFFLKYNDFSQLRTIRPVTPYPGSELYDIAVESGLIKDPADFFKKFKNSDLMTVNFTKLSDAEFYEELFKANKIMIDSYYKYQIKILLESFRNLYKGEDYSFRGPRHE